MRAIGGNRLDGGAAAHLGHLAADDRLRWHHGGEFEREAAAFAELAFDADAPTVLFEYFLADRKAKACSATTLLGEEYTENLVQVIVLDAAASIDNGDASHSFLLTILSRDFDMGLFAAVARVDRITYHV